MSGRVSVEEQERQVLEDLDSVQAIRTGGHYVYTGGEHGSVYVNKDAVYPHIRLVKRYTGLIAREFAADGVQTVLGAALGAIILETWVTYHMLDFSRDVCGVYAEKVKGEFCFTRGYCEFIRGRRVLIVEDVINTGKTVRRMVQLVQEYEGEVLGIGAIVNRGGQTADSLGVPKLVTLLDYPAVKHPADDCPLCHAGVPINTDVGKGAEFLAARDALAS